MFDIFGNVLARLPLDQSFKTEAQAYKSLKANLAELDIRTQTLDGLERYKRQCAVVESDILAWLEQLKHVAY